MLIMRISQKCVMGQNDEVVTICTDMDVNCNLTRVFSKVTSTWVSGAGDRTADTLIEVVPVHH